MKHRVAGRKLNRTSKHRQALFKNVVGQLVLHGEITTTEAKAKSVQATVEKMITKAKAQTLHARRQLHAYFNDKTVTSRLVDQIAPKLSGRTSGYTRIRKVGYRRGDNALLVKLSLVDKVVLIDEKQDVAKAKTSKKESVKTKTAQK